MRTTLIYPFLMLVPHAVFRLVPLAALLALCLFTVSVGAAGFIPLGDVPSGINNFSSYFVDISDDGAVAVGREALPNSRISAIQWTDATDIVSFTSPDPGANVTWARGVSGNGSVVAVWSGRRSYRWTEIGGYVDLGGLSNDVDSIVFGISQDGTVIVGSSEARTTADGLIRLFDAYRWTEGTGMINLGTLDSEMGSVATAVSSDGDTVVGNSAGQAFRWTQSTGIVGLGSSTYGFSKAYAVSGDGSIVLGGLTDDNPFDTSGGSGLIELAVWSDSSGWTLVESNVVTFSTETANMSDDGSQIVFNKLGPKGAGAAYVWTINEGQRLLSDILVNNLGLASEIDGWDIASESLLTAVSRDGRFLVGMARNPTGIIENFLVDLQIPEPTTFTLFTLALIGYSIRRHPS